MKARINFFKGKEDAIDILESYVGAGKTVIPVDIVKSDTKTNENQRRFVETND